MSVKALGAVFEHSQSSGSARLVLLAMADEANDQGLLTSHRRSQSWLMKKANLARSSVQRGIRDLVELGELEVLRVGHARAKSDYRLRLAGLAPLDGSEDPIVVQVETTQPETTEIETPQDRASKAPGSVVRGPRVIPQRPQVGTSITPFSPVTPVQTRGASFLDFVADPDHPFTVGEKVSAIIDAASVRSANRFSPKEQRTLRGWLPDAVRNGYHPNDLTIAIADAPFKSEASVLGELRKGKQTQAQSVGDKNIAVGLAWASGDD